MIAEYNALLPDYESKKNYYDGKHLIYNDKHFKVRKDMHDMPMHINWISKFIGEEISYALNKPVSYASKSGNVKLEKAISAAIEHFDLNHDQKIMRELEIYGKCFILYYFDKHGRLSERILNPTNAIAYVDEDGNIIRFIYFYKKKYHDGEYRNVYYDDGTIEVYKDNLLLEDETETHPFQCMPVSVCEIEDAETIYTKIKSLNDAYNELISNQQSLISEFKNAYITMCDAGVSDESTKAMKTGLKDPEAGIIFYPHKDAKPEWLIKNINDAAIKNQLEEIKENLYAQSGHIDFNEKLLSNISGVALQSRLTGLDQRVNMVLNPVLNVLYERVRFICMYLLIQKNMQYDFTDIKIAANIDIPMDVAGRINEVNQLGDIVSHQTKLERLPFIENPQIELERIKKEKENSQAINLDVVNSAFYGSGGGGSTE